MRGINHQDIFCDAEDYYHFITTLDRMRAQYDDDGNPCGTNCTYYAYCLMSNHFHLLVREREEPVGDTIKRIASSYVYYFNRKYGRDGHLFKEQFKSESFISAQDILLPQRGMTNPFAHTFSFINFTSFTSLPTPLRQLRFQHIYLPALHHDLMSKTISTSKPLHISSKYHILI